VDDVVKHIKDVMLEEHVRAFGSLKRAVEFALELGVNMGILSMTKTVRMPIRYRRSKSKTKVPVRNRIPLRLGRQLHREATGIASAGLRPTVFN